MRSTCSILCVGILLCESGCLLPSTPDGKIVGVVKKGTNDHVFVHLEDTEIGTNVTRTLVEPLQLDETVTSKDFVVVLIEDDNTVGDDLVLVGPIFSAVEPDVQFSLSSLRLYNGWAIATGSWPPPVIKTGLVQAAATGTTFAIRFDSTTGQHYVYLLRKTSPTTELHIECGSYTYALTEECQWMEFDACTPFPPPTNTSNGGDARIDQFKEYLRAIGWNEPKNGSEDCGLTWTP